MGSARNGEDTSKIDAHAPELYVLTDGSHVISSQHGQLGRELGEKRQEEPVEGLPNGNY